MPRCEIISFSKLSLEFRSAKVASGWDHNSKALRPLSGHKQTNNYRGFLILRQAAYGQLRTFHCGSAGTNLFNSSSKFSTSITLRSSFLSLAAQLPGSCWHCRNGFISSMPPHHCSLFTVPLQNLQLAIPEGPDTVDNQSRGRWHQDSRCCADSPSLP